MKHELREGSFIIKSRSTYHILRNIYENSLVTANTIMLENKIEDYDDDHFVQSLRSRSLNHNNIVPTMNDLGCNRLRYYKSLLCKSRKASYPYTLKTQCGRR